MNTHKCWIFLLGILIACQSESGNKEDFNPPYFQLEEFVESQAKFLKDKKLLKEIQFDTSRENIEMTPTEEEWLEELDFFIQADINRPSLAQSYTVEKNGNEVNYTLKKGEKSKVKSLNIHFFEDEKPSRIEFVIGSENTFYSSTTNGWLIVDQSSNLISEFEVNGQQKVVFLDQISMNLKGKVSN